MMKQSVLTAVIWQEENQYVSQCPELGVASCGETPDHALEMLKEAVELYVENAQLLGIWADIEGSIASTHRFTAPLEITIP